MKYSALIVFCIFVSAGFAQQLKFEKHPSVKVEKAPSWVKHIDYNYSTPAEDELHTQTLLADAQYNVNKQTRYYRTVWKILSKEGCQQFTHYEMDFDPSYETLIIHRIRKKRNGVWVAASDLSNAQLVQKEQGLPRYRYSGLRSLVCFLKDVVIGDEIETVFSIVGQNPVFKNIFHENYLLGRRYPIHKHSLRVIKPRSSTLQYDVQGTDLEPICLENANTTEWHWMSNTPLIIKYEDYQPIESIKMPTVYFSDYQSWNEVALWAVELYKIPSVTCPSVLELIKNWQKDCSDPREKALIALRYVQDNISYFGVDLGENSFKPQDPNTVLEHKQGDCKDKALLLTTLLQHMGIEARLVFVHTYFKDLILDRLPSPYSFNHVIVEVQIDDKKYWVDPTMCCQGGSLEQSQVRTTAGLVIHPTTQDLYQHKNDNMGTIATTSKIHIGEFLEASLDLEITYTGILANRYRSQHFYEGTKPIQTNLEDAFKRYYQHYKIVHPLRIIDDKVNNRFKIQIGLELTKPWINFMNGQWHPIMPIVLGDTLHEDIDLNRSAPYDPDLLVSDITEKFEVSFADGLSVATDNEAHSVYNEFFNLNYKANAQPDQITIKFAAKLKNKTVNPAQLDNYLTSLKDAREFVIGQGFIQPHMRKGFLNGCRNGFFLTSQSSHHSLIHQQK